MTRIIKYKNYQFNRSLSIKKTLKSDTILSKQVTHVFRKSLVSLFDSYRGTVLDRRNNLINPNWE
jgi:hypothetical protein